MPVKKYYIVFYWKLSRMGLGEEIMIQCDSSSSIKPGNKKDSRASEL